MSLPFFYKADIDANNPDVLLDEDTSKHIIQVLRMQLGEQLRLTDGKGNSYTTAIIDDNRKRTSVKINEHYYTQPPSQKAMIAISLLKNTARWEWFLEKAAELGVERIVPVLCTRTEKEKFRYDRMKSILISAMLQSQQVWLPALSEPVAFNDLVSSQLDGIDKMIAYCDEDRKCTIEECLHEGSSGALVLIGPPGDFTPDEIALAKQYAFQPVTLGTTRLRTETAGIAAAVCLKL